MIFTDKVDIPPVLESLTSHIKIPQTTPAQLAIQALLSRSDSKLPQAKVIETRSGRSQYFTEILLSGETPEEKQSNYDLVARDIWVEAFKQNLVADSSNYTQKDFELTVPLEETPANKKAALGKMKAVIDNWGKEDKKTSGDRTDLYASGYHVATIDLDPSSSMLVIKVFGPNVTLFAFHIGIIIQGNLGTQFLISLPGPTQLFEEPLTEVSSTSR